MLNLDQRAVDKNCQRKTCQFGFAAPACKPGCQTEQRHRRDDSQPLIPFPLVDVIEMAIIHGFKPGYRRRAEYPPERNEPRNWSCYFCNPALRQNTKVSLQWFKEHHRQSKAECDSQRAHQRMKHKRNKKQRRCLPALPCHYPRNTP